MLLFTFFGGKSLMSDNMLVKSWYESPKIWDFAPPPFDGDKWQMNESACLLFWDDGVARRAISHPP